MNLVTCCIVFWKRRAVIVSVLDRILKEPARILVAVCFYLLVSLKLLSGRNRRKYGNSEVADCNFLIIKVT